MTGLSLVVWTILTYGVNKASCQRTVQVSEGDDVLLPCLYTDGNLPPNPSVFWKDKDDNNVFDIKKPSQSEGGYSVLRFPNQYKKGNFSIVLQSVRLSDAGVFECHILDVDFLRNVRLSVIRKRVETTPRPGSSGSGSSGPSDGSSTVTPLLLLHILLLLSFCF